MPQHRLGHRLDVIGQYVPPSAEGSPRLRRREHHQPRTRTRSHFDAQAAAPAQAPVKFGGRFSMKALMPSLASLLRVTIDE